MACEPANGIDLNEDTTLVTGHNYKTVLTLAPQILKAIEAEQIKENAPEFKTGDTVKVYAKIKEGTRERIQIFEGTVLKKQGGSNRATFTVRKSSNGVGVERTWPLHSPHIEKVEVIRRGKARRAKLFYLRDRVGKKAKVKELV